MLAHIRVLFFSLNSCTGNLLIYWLGVAVEGETFSGVSERSVQIVIFLCKYILCLHSAALKILKLTFFN